MLHIVVFSNALEDFPETEHLQCAVALETAPVVFHTYLLVDCLRISSP